MRVPGTQFDPCLGYCHFEQVTVYLHILSQSISDHLRCGRGGFILNSSKWVETFRMGHLWHLEVGYPHDGLADATLIGITIVELAVLSARQEKAIFKCYTVI